MTGWSLAPGGRHEEVTSRLNGREFERIEYPMPSAYLAQAFTFREDGETLGVHVLLPRHEGDRVP